MGVFERRSHRANVVRVWSSSTIGVSVFCPTAFPPACQSAGGSVSNFPYPLNGDIRVIAMVCHGGDGVEKHPCLSPTSLSHSLLLCSWCSPKPLICRGQAVRAALGTEGRTAVIHPGSAPALWYHLLSVINDALFGKSW
jgi:hypothetical protein